MAKKYYWINLILILIIVCLVTKIQERTSPPPAEKETAGSKQNRRCRIVLRRKKGEAEPSRFRSVRTKTSSVPTERVSIPLAPEVAKKPPVRPNIQLFGVATGEGFHSALITNPTRKRIKVERDDDSQRRAEVGEYS